MTDLPIKQKILDEADADIMEVVYNWARINFDVEVWVQDSTEIRDILSRSLDEAAAAARDKARGEMIANSQGFIETTMVDAKAFALAEKRGRAAERAEVVKMIEEASEKVQGGGNGRRIFIQLIGRLKEGQIK